jgi:hypothetical protein
MVQIPRCFSSASNFSTLHSNEAIQEVHLEPRCNLLNMKVALESEFDELKFVVFNKRACMYIVFK